LTQGTLEGKTKEKPGVMIYAHIDYLGEICILTDADGNPVLSSTLEAITINCP
jgi:hypothetical protein